MWCGGHTILTQGSAPAASPSPPPWLEALRAGGHPVETAHEHGSHKGGWSCMGTEMKLPRVAHGSRAHFDKRCEETS